MQTTTAPSFIYWYKGKQLINYSQAGGAINVITDRQTRTSNLLIAKASPADNGNYTCSPSNSGEFFFLYFFLDFIRIFYVVCFEGHGVFCGFIS